MTRKLATWKGSLLSLGGRATLIKASLSSLPMYYMSIFPTPIGVIDKLRRLQRQFFWCGTNGKNRLPPATWHLIELPKSLGGLNMGNLQTKNLALLAKWVWRYVSDTQTLWRKLIHEKYKYGPLFSILDLQTSSHGGPWKSICATLLTNPQSKALLKSGIRKRIGNGMNSLFWHDVWLGDLPLKAICPRLFRLSNAKNTTVASSCFWDGIKWEWAFDWSRPLRPRDKQEFGRLQQLLEPVCLSMNDKDELIWTPHKKGVFSVKSFNVELAKNDINGPQRLIQGLWRNLVPYRIEIFSWLALLGKLNTKEKLVRLGILEPPDGLCTLCTNVIESCDHIFIHCPMASNIWNWWLNI